jgi:hypothetical protein
VLRIDHPHQAPASRRGKPRPGHFPLVAVAPIVHVRVGPETLDHVGRAAHVIRMRMRDPHERKARARQIFLELREQVRVVPPALGTPRPIGLVARVDE